MSRLVEELVKSGQPHNLMCPNILMWVKWKILRRESTIIAESLLVVVLLESGATPLTQIRDGNSALSQFVMQHTTVSKVIHWV